jgi:hypothetical protein
MPTTTRQLITKSLYLSGLVARDFQTISGSELRDTHDLLNSILSFKAIDSRKIPYFEERQFPTVIVPSPQEKYFIPGLISVETLTYELNSARIPMRSVERYDYFNTYRIATLPNLPSVYHVEKCIGGANIFLYPLPNSVYIFTMYANFRLMEVTIDQDLELTFDKFYIEYLRYLLASYVCDFYEISLPIAVQRRLDEYESEMVDTSPVDFTMKKVSTLNQRNWPYHDSTTNIGIIFPF